MTLFIVVIPFLTFKAETLADLTGLASPDLAFYRLYGIAILALLVAYSGGLQQTLNSTYPIVIVAMGTVSNLGAALVMILTGYASDQILGTVFFAAVGVGFAISAAFPDWVMRKVF